MYNAAIRTLIIAALLSMTACNGKNSTASQAESIVNEVQAAIDAGDYSRATDLLDTLKTKFPTEIEAQREGMHLRPLAIEGQTIKEIEETDSFLAVYTHHMDSLMQYFTLVDNPQLVEGYYVIKDYAKSTLFNRTGVESRVSPDGQFYMISSLTTRPVKHTSISLSNTAGKVTTSTVGYDGERNYRSGGTEMITFTGAECDTLGYFISQNSGVPTKLSFNGTSTYTTPLNSTDKKSMELAYKLSQAMSGSRKMASRREFLDRQLILARDQAARTSAEEEKAHKD